MHPIDIKADFKEFPSGRLFCLKISGKLSQARKVVLLVPPFAEEMNKSRKMMSLLLAEIADDTTCGYLFDLYGTGDSDGDFSQATWDIWRANLIDMLNFIGGQQGVEQIAIVAIRTGALLLNSVLADETASSEKIKSIHYWNPVLNPSLFIGQFLRLKLAANMMRNDGPKVGVKELRQQLFEEGTLEVAGYTLNKDLIDGMEEAAIALPPSLSELELHYYELSSLGQPTPGLMKKITEVGGAEEKRFTHVIEGAQFWSTQEIALCEPLLDMTKKHLFAE